MKIVTTLIRTLVLVAVSFSVFAEETLHGPGNWTEKSYSIAGEWKIIHRDDTRFIVFNDDFKTRRGPDLKVYLSKTPIAEVRDQDVADSSIKISPLISNKGSQEYAIPADIDLQDYSSLLIHCEAYAHLWGGAAIH